MNCAEKRERGKCLNCKSKIGGDLINSKNKKLFPDSTPKVKQPKSEENEKQKKIPQSEFKKMVGEQIMQFFRQKYHFHEKLIDSADYFGIPKNIFHFFYLLNHTQFLFIGLINEQHPLVGFDDYFSNQYCFGNL